MRGVVFLTAPAIIAPLRNHRLAWGDGMASVLITGTSKGIGFETALTFARAGHQVHATMRNPAQSPELAATAARENLPLTVTAMNVDSDESVAAAFALIYDSHGSIDVLVNNAGIERVGAIEELRVRRLPRRDGDELLRRASLY